MIGTLKVEKRKIMAPGGDYRAIVVPACKYMPQETLKHLAVLAECGARIIFEKGLPADVPGLADLEKRRAQFAADRARLEKAKVGVVDDVAKGLEGVVSREPMTDAGLRFVRRKVGEAYWYYIANHTAKDFDGWLALALPFSSATLFDPMTGNSGRLARRGKSEGSQVYLQIAAGQTLILRAETGLAKAGPWPYLKPEGKPVTLSGDWSIEFIEGEPDLPAGYKAKELSSWTKAPDLKAQAFAGTARYTLSFAAPENAEDDWLLDLGDVRESARVRLNGKDAGTLIAIPFRMRVGALLKPGENTLEIEVTNLSANRIRDLERRKVNWKIMGDINIVNVHYKKFEPGKWSLAPSGLLGPVKLIPANRYVPKP
jgi:hypothetical protein